MQLVHTSLVLQHYKDLVGIVVGGEAQMQAWSELVYSNSIVYTYSVVPVVL